MPATMPALLYVLDADGAPQPVRASGLLNTAPAVQHYASGMTGTLGDQILVANPGSGYQIVVFKLLLQTLTGTLTTAKLKWGSDEIGGGVFNTQYSWLQMDFPAPDRLSGGDNQPLLLNLDGANNFNYLVMYYVQAV